VIIRFFCTYERSRLLNDLKMRERHNMKKACFVVCSLTSLERKICELVVFNVGWAKFSIEKLVKSETAIHNYFASSIVTVREQQLTVYLGVSVRSTYPQVYDHPEPSRYIGTTLLKIPKPEEMLFHVILTAVRLEYRQ
jgi:hypothetical protein